MSQYAKILGVWQEIESTGPNGHVLKSNGLTVNRGFKLYSAPTDEAPVAPLLSPETRALLQKHLHHA